MKHGYDGQCSPRNTQYQWRHDTFSLGIFPLIPRKTKVGYKRGAVIVRVKGWTSDPDAVYEKAQKIVELLDAGKYAGPKFVDARCGAEKGEKR